MLWSTPPCFTGAVEVMQQVVRARKDRSRTPVRGIPTRLLLTPRAQVQARAVPVTDPTKLPESEQVSANTFAYDMGKLVAHQYPEALIEQTTEFFADTLVNKPYHTRQYAIRHYTLNAVAGPNYKHTCRAIALTQDCARMLRSHFVTDLAPVEYFRKGMVDSIEL